MSHRGAETQRVNKDLKYEISNLRFQIWNLKFYLPLCLRASVANLIRSASRVIVFLLLTFILTNHSAQFIHAAQPASQHSIATRDGAFLEDLERRMFRYFWEEADPKTGLVPDRARMDGSPLDVNHQNVASIAATGFGLTALSIAAER